MSLDLWDNTVRVSEDLQTEIEQNQELGQSIAGAIFGIDSNFDSVTIEGDLEPNGNGEAVPRLTVYVPASSVSEWQKKERVIREAVREAEGDDTLIYTTVERVSSSGRYNQLKSAVNYLDGRGLHRFLE